MDCGAACVCCTLRGVCCTLRGVCCTLRGVCCTLRGVCCSTAAQPQLEELQLGSANGHLEGLKDEALLMAVLPRTLPSRHSVPQAVQAGRSYSFVRWLARYRSRHMALQKVIGNGFNVATIVYLLWPLLELQRER